MTLTHMHCVGVCPCAETMFVHRLKWLPVTVEHGMHRARSKYGIEQGDRVRHFIPADLVDAELSDRKDTIERALKSLA